MDNWQFDITDAGKKDLEKLDPAIRYRVLEKLKWFTENFQNIMPLPLGDPLRGFLNCALEIGE